MQKYDFKCKAFKKIFFFRKKYRIAINLDNVETPTLIPDAEYKFTGSLMITMDHIELPAGSYDIHFDGNTIDYMIFKVSKVESV